MTDRRRRSVAVLGSTGSVGTQSLAVIRDHPDRFAVVALAASGSRPQLLAEQAAEFAVRAVAVADPDAVASVRAELAAAGCETVALEAGAEAVAELAGCGADVVLNGITGAAGLAATLNALRAGSRLALANKESLVIGGQLVTDLAAAGQIVPVDSEHSAILQCLRAGAEGEVARLVLTASGGPFRGVPRADLAQVTPAQALAHPTWAMGPVITTNSATMVNKGLEVIEAHLLFGLELDRIEVVIHPQSVVHSWVEFVDGSCVLQASPPDMRLPIAVALGWPDRLPAAAAPLDPAAAGCWTFEPLPAESFPAVPLARRVGRLGGTYPGVYNASNEVAVAAFLAGELGFLDIVDVVAAVVADHGDSAAVLARPTAPEQVLAADAWARQRARWQIGQLKGTGNVIERGTP